jgi:tripartite-type tricarboxylate transporter receptor subunit TctC
MILKRMISLAIEISLLFFLGGGVFGQDKYPSRPIELVVAFGPGGSVDLSARMYGEELSKALKVPVTVVNRAGGTGIQGTSYVARSRKDGYTLLQGATQSIVLLPIISNEVNYDPQKDFIPLAHFASVPSVLVVRNESPFKTLDDVIDYARKNPGKLNNGGTGFGSESQFNLDILCIRNKIQINSIPFKGGGEVLSTIVGGHVDLSFLALPTMGPQIKAGKLRGLAVTSKTRHPDFPQILTTAELGHPYVDFSIGIGVFAPAGVPKSVLNVLVPTLENIFKNPEIVQRATNAGFSVAYMGPQEFQTFIDSRRQVYEKVAHEVGLAKK